MPFPTELTTPPVTKIYFAMQKTKFKDSTKKQPLLRFVGGVSPLL